MVHVISFAMIYAFPWDGQFGAATQTLCTLLHMAIQSA